MESLIENKAITIKSFWAKTPLSKNIAQYVEEGAFFKVNKIMSEDIKITIRLKGDLTFLDDNYGRGAYINIHFIKGTPADYGSKVNPIRINKEELNYEIAYVPDTKWGGLIESANEINPIDYVVFECPKVGLQFDACLFVRANVYSMH